MNRGSLTALFATALVLSFPASPLYGEQEADSLRAEIDALNQRLAAIEQQQHSAPAASELQILWDKGLLFRSQDKTLQVRLGGRVQQDWAQVVQVDDALDEAIDGIDSGVEFRRVRLDVSGTVYERMYFIAQLDFAGDKTAMTEMYVAVKDLPGLGQLLIGHTQEPIGMDSRTSNKYIQFVERPSLSAFWPFYNAGVMMQRNLFDKRSTLTAGVFRETDAQGKATSNDAYQFTGRFTVLPYVSDQGGDLVHLGIAASRRTYDDGTVRFRMRPESHLMPYYVDTEAFDAENATIYGIEAAAVFGSLSFQAEYDATATEDPAADHDFSGWYGQVGYFLTGEQLPYSKSNGAFTRLIPIQNAFGKEGGIGAWELAARYSTIDLNDGEVAGGEMDIITTAINWYLNPNMRLMVDYSIADLAEVGKSQVVTTRMQFDF
ncbi:MAG: hypothetical protein KDL10_08920 [Kiritimatiellae bacterium]|nr:hypothetical protein [Kiritimatiellia bacterium]